GSSVHGVRRTGQGGNREGAGVFRAVSAFVAVHRPDAGRRAGPLHRAASDRNPHRGGNRRRTEVRVRPILQMTSGHPGGRGKAGMPCFCGGREMSVSNLQKEIIARLGVKPNIDPDEEIRRRVDFLKEKVLEAGASGLLIAISGGVDSAVTAGLCKRATDELAAETGRPYITVGLFQPYGEQPDIADAYAVAEAFRLKYTAETNIRDAVDEIALEA